MRAPQDIEIAPTTTFSYFKRRTAQQLQHFMKFIYFQKMQMFNQEMQNAQESAEAKTQAKFGRKRFGIFCSLQCLDPWTTNTPNQQIGTIHTAQNCKNSRLPSSPDCARYRYYSSTEPLFGSCNNKMCERRKTLKSRQRQPIMILSAERPSSFNIS